MIPVACPVGLSFGDYGMRDQFDVRRGVGFKEISLNDAVQRAITHIMAV